MRTTSSSLLVIAVLAVLASPTSSSAGSNASIVFEPAAPTTFDEIQILATYLTECSSGGQVEVIGSTVRVHAYEGCICPAVLPLPRELAGTLNPLEPGSYTVELVVEPDPSLEDCSFEPRLETTAELEVTGAIEFEIEPPVPTAADDVTLVLRSQCPDAYELPSRNGQLIRLTQIPSMIAAPCTQDPSWVSRFSLGQLPAGDYNVVHFSPGGDLVHTFAFTVEPDAATDLLFLDGRFKVTVLWQTTTGFGTASGVPFTDASGVFWFFEPANYELLVKVLNGCGVNGHYWVFAAGGTDVGVTIEVEDTGGTLLRSYTSPVGESFLPVLDTAAFPCS